MSLPRRGLLVALLALAGCGRREPPDAPVPVPAPAPGRRPVDRPAAPATPDRDRGGAPFTAGPGIRVGLLVNVERATLGGGGALVVRPAGGGAAIIIPAGRSVAVERSGGGITLEGIDRPRRVAAPFTVLPAEATGFVRAGGRDHRGTLEVRVAANGITLIAHLAFETYLAGVVAAELGVQDADVAEALKAQSVIARTYAVRNLRRYDRQGYDLLATVSDQRYDGVAGESPAVWRALEQTRGQVATWQGTPIDAFFHSTCGGRTASGREVFANADRPYLRSVSDLDPSGQAWCRTSPRFRWDQSWDRDAVVAALRRGLRLTAEEAEGVRSIEATTRSGSGRVTQLRVRLRGRDVVIDGSNALRRALPPSGLDLLRSAAFTLTYRSSGERIDRLDMRGQGSGHGVGLCQWGAIGRARAGQPYADILVAYYPGTRLERRW